ncbi:Serine-threonine/tyrosine-protein kinase [Hirschfeldia incana]|nr:Serine-threonine/tyrosine-protein kinase [Hirschfeldia incana]
MAGSCSSSQPQYLFLVFFFLFLPFLSFAQEPAVNVNGTVWEFPSHSSSSSQQSTFSKNLNSLIASILDLHANTYNFYNLSVGDISDQDRVEAIGVCNRVVRSVACRDCVFEAAINLTTTTSSQVREGYWRATNCMFRYSDKPIFGILETNPTFEALSPNKSAGDGDEFNRLQSELLNRFRKQAAAGGSKRKYIQGQGPGPLPNTTLFGAVMCTPDLSEEDCNECLIFGFANATRGRSGLRWFCPSCSFQIQTNLRFFHNEEEYERDPPSDQEPGILHNWSEGVDKTIIILATVGSVVGFAIFVVCLYFILRRKKRKQKQIHEGKYVVENQIIDENVLRLDFDTIRLATDDFSPGNQLGEGGFGVVYKGVLDSGEEIAVKRLSMKSGQGDNEFINEVSLVAKLHHRNLVRLLGFCLEGQERLLIYDLFKNTSLDHFIFDNDRRMVLEWETRYKIIAGVARGLLYLHEDSRFKVIHRDLKASNVLLDDAMYPKISDFGMAKLFDTEQPCQARFTSRVAGTYGYMAPEYAMNGKFSVKTDVFSFGVLVLEIITGKRNNWSPEDKSSLFLLSYIWKNWREGRVLNIVDPSLIQTRGLSDEIMKCIHIGLLCVQEKAESRPTMASVVLMLNANSFTLLRPSQPGFYPGDGESASSSPPTMTLNSVTITKVDPR